MRKTFIILTILLLTCYGFGLWRDMETLHEQVIRLHVVGASDSEADQQVKLAVKDAINAELKVLLDHANTVDEAKSTISNNLQSLKAIGEQVLRDHGSYDTIEITLGQEAFPLREYDTFTLPSGVYSSLRIKIGRAEGKNWWCVVFPSLCLPAAGENLEDVAAGAGFTDTLCDTLTGAPEYEIRFFFLDWMGKLQNFWFET